MTVSTTTNKISYAGNGSTTLFTFPFKIFAEGDLKLILRVDSTGVETEQTITTNYTVSAGPYDSGGSVTMLVAPASGETLLIKTEIDETQTLDLVENDELPAESVEDALDRQTLLIQQVSEQLGRAILQAETDTAMLVLPSSVARADKFAKFDSSGNIVAVEELTAGTLTVSSFIENNLLNVVDAAAARTAIGAAASGAFATLAANTFTGVQRWAKGADVASAAALTLGTDGNFFDITGTVAITSIGSLGVGTLVALQFDGSLTLTHHATDLILPFGGQNWTTKAGDVFLFFEYASGDWICVGHPPIIEPISIDTISSAVAAVTRTSLDLTPYREVIIDLDELQHDTGNITIQHRVTVGGSEKSGASDYRNAQFVTKSNNATANGGSNSDTKIPLNHNGLSAADRHSFSIRWRDLEGDDTPACFIDGYYFEHSSIQYHRFVGGGSYKTAEAINGFVLRASSGNLTGGTMRIYGARL